MKESLMSELARIDREIAGLRTHINNMGKKERRETYCLLGGAVFLIGALPLFLPFKDDTWIWNGTYEHLSLYIGLPLFLYGWLLSRERIGRLEKLRLCELARLFKQTEADDKLTLTTQLEIGGLAFHFHDKEKGPGQRCWVKRLYVTYRWGRLQFSAYEQPTELWWRENQKQEERTDYDHARKDREDREYRVYTLQLSRHTIDAGYEIHGRHFIPGGEAFEGWELVSVCPLEGKANEYHITILALIARTIDVSHLEGGEKEKRKDYETIERREYKVYTLKLSRSAIDTGYEMHARHFKPQLEGWELLSVCPLEGNADEEYITILALITRNS